MGLLTLFSLDRQRKARKADKKVNEAQRKINRLRNEQNKRAYMRQFRQAQAAAIQGAIASGVGIGSSAFQGTLSSQATQAETALGEFKKFDELGDVMTSQMNKASGYRFQAGLASQVQGLAMSFVPGMGSGSVFTPSVPTVPKVTTSNLPDGP